MGLAVKVGVHGLQFVRKRGRAARLAAERVGTVSFLRRLAAGCNLSSASLIDDFVAGVPWSMPARARSEGAEAVTAEGSGGNAGRVDDDAARAVGGDGGGAAIGRNTRVRQIELRQAAEVDGSGGGTAAEPRRRYAIARCGGALVRRACGGGQHTRPGRALVFSNWFVKQGSGYKFSVTCRIVVRMAFAIIGADGANGIYFSRAFCGLLVALAARAAALLHAPFAVGGSCITLSTCATLSLSLLGETPCRVRSAEHTGSFVGATFYLQACRHGAC